MRKTKLEKGITLVALIITIVVLLILAVVSIGAVKNSGIIGQAQNTADMWKTAKTEEDAKLLQYENYFKKWKVYGTAEEYIIISSDFDVLLHGSKEVGWAVNEKANKLSKEEYIQKYIEKVADTDEFKNYSSEEIANMLYQEIEEFENDKNTSIDYFLSLGGISVTDGALIMAGDRVLVGEDFYGPNEELAKQVVRKKGTFEVYDLANLNDNDEEDSKESRFTVDITDCFYLVDENGFYVFLGNSNSAGWDYRGTVSTNDEEFKVKLADESEYTITKGAKKLSYIRDDLEEGWNWYIQDEKLWVNGGLTGVTPGETVGGINKADDSRIDQIDFEKYGILVIE